MTSSDREERLARIEALRAEADAVAANAGNPVTRTPLLVALDHLNEAAGILRREESTPEREAWIMSTVDLKIRQAADQLEIMRSALSAGDSDRRTSDD